MVSFSGSIDDGHCVCNYEQTVIQSHTNDFVYSGVRIEQIRKLDNTSTGLEACQRAGYFIKCFQSGEDDKTNASASADYVTYLVLGFMCLGFLVTVVYLYRKVKKLEGKIREMQQQHN